MDIDADPNTPIEPKEPFASFFSIKIIETIKDGDQLFFKIVCKSLSTLEEYLTLRNFDDFEYLHHQLTVRKENRCRILPPIPNRPIVDAKSAQEQSKKMFGKRLKNLISDEYEMDIRSFEKYLSILLSHDVFGKDAILHRFLTVEKPPASVSIAKVKTTLDVKKFNHTDIDDYFTYQHNLLVNFKDCITKTLMEYSKYVNSQQRISHSYHEIASQFCVINSSECLVYKNESQIFNEISTIIQNLQHCTNVGLLNDEYIMKFHLDFYSRYADSCQDVLNERRKILMEYEEANACLGKAKSGSMVYAHEKKDIIEKELECYSDIAKKEMFLYHRQKLRAYEDVLQLYAQAKIQTARETILVISKSIEKLKLNF